MVIPVGHEVLLGDEAVVGVVDGGGLFRQVELHRLPKERALPYGDGLALLGPYEFVVMDSATMTVGVLDDTVCCLGLQALPGMTLTGALLRSLPVAALTRAYAASHSVVLRKKGKVRYGVFPIEAGAGFGDLHRLFEQRLARITHKRRVLNDDFLRSVASVYRVALSLNLPPAVAVQEEFGPTTAENARRWVMMARKAGYLGESLGRGKRGEIQVPNVSS